MTSPDLGRECRRHSVPTFIWIMADQRTKGMLLLDFGSVVILNTCFQPLVAFSYFCLHSIRHTLLSADLRLKHQGGSHELYRSAWGRHLSLRLLADL